MATVTGEQLEAVIGPRAEYYLRRFERMDSGRQAGWNWAAFFFSTAWFSYRGLTGWAALNFGAPWLTLLALAGGLGEPLLIAYPIVFFLLVPMYADALYYRRVKRKLAEGSTPDDGPSP